MAYEDIVCLVRILCVLQEYYMSYDGSVCVMGVLCVL
jgi:hypothetical protein